VRKPSGRRLALAGGAVAGALALVVVAGVVLPATGSDQHNATDDGPTSSATSAAATGLAAQIDGLQEHLRTAPQDYVSWGQLGLAYVQQAKNTVNPAYYPKATGALAQSLKLNSATNYVGMAGQAALESAEHHFSASKTWALKGLKANPDNPTLYGTLADAQTQLGDYTAAAASVQTMNDLQPGVAAFTRAEYVFELRGDLVGARTVMQRAYDDSSNASDRGYAAYYLGELSFNSGDPAGALRETLLGLEYDPNNSALLEGKARAEAALGNTQQALVDYQRVVDEVPQPQYVLEYGDLLASLGQTAKANTQYQLFEAENKLFTANGVSLDTDPTLFYADHGQPALALEYGTSGIKSRPFVEMQDAYAWALYANGRYAEALQYEQKVQAVGMRNALFGFHRGMIQKALGQNAAAKASLTAALTLNPHFNPRLAPMARQALASLGGAS
jgi:tetratricopeptide (TPR) repeat protein